MVIPSRWLAGGRGLGGFRAKMLESKEVSKLVDYPNYRDVFPSVTLMGGVCYFLKSAKYKKEECSVTIIRDGKESTKNRRLNEFDVFIRDSISVGILRKVLKLKEQSIIEILTADTPFGLASNFGGYRTKPSTDDIKLYLREENKERKVRYIPRTIITKNEELIDKWKVLVPGARGGGETLPDVILGQPWVSPPPSAATQTFIAFYVDGKKQADSLESYYRTKFFRHLVSLRKITQQASRSVYTWVPKQTWDRQWSDTDLYEKYSLTKREIEYIESSIKSMPKIQQKKGEK